MCLCVYEWSLLKPLGDIMVDLSGFFKFAYLIIFAACNICYIIYDEHSLFREGDGLQQAGQSRSPVVIV